MSRIRGQGTEAERIIFKLLRKKGVYFTKHVKSLPGCPDVVFRRYKLAVFIDGDFWHGHQWKTRGFSSIAKQFERSNSRSYWIAKIERTVERDKTNTRLLRRNGWKVLRVWETEVRRAPETCVKRILRHLEALSKNA